mmetsp:Transcript_26534/g.57879  ORF Transcript_26534/g.57879 Transcript_26534/m.57879 type:complete len:91 (+) Transcript_26534:292-564(+)
MSRLLGPSTTVPWMLKDKQQQQQQQQLLLKVQPPVVDEGAPNVMMPAYDVIDVKHWCGTRLDAHVNKLAEVHAYAQWSSGNEVHLQGGAS